MKNTKLSAKKRLLLLMIAVCATLTTAYAQPQQPCPPLMTCPTMDGSPADWPGVFADPDNLIKRMIVDPVNSATDNIFTTGSADNVLLNTWGWTLKSSNDKNDLGNTGIALIGHTLYFFADRHANNGDAKLGVWIFRNPISLNPNGTFSGVHSDGDILLNTHFINGGSIADRQIYRWEINAAHPAPGALVLATNQLSTMALNFQANAAPVAAPFPYTPKSGPAGTYPENSFIEGFLDLDSLIIGQQFDVCFSSFMIETGNSQSVSSSLEDFVLGRFGSVPEKMALTPTPFCSSSPNTGSITGSVIVNGMGSEIGVNYQLFTLAGAPTQAAKPGNGSPLTWTGLGGGTYYVVATNASTNCITNSDTVTVNAKPAPICSITGNNNVCPGSSNNYSAPAGMTSYAWSITGGGTISGSTSSQSVTVIAGSTCGSYTLTVTIDSAGCTSTCNRQLFITDNTPPVLTASGNNLTLGCNPSTATINGALGSASATDNCGTPTVTMSNGSIVSSGCLRSQTRSWTAIDQCGNTSTASRTATWTEDNTAPTLTASGGNLTLGCNPSTATINGALGTASATDACGAPTVTSTTGSIQSSGCLRSQTRSWTAIDGCGNTSTAARTATWTEDNTAPTLTATGGNLTLGCNPSTATIDGALGSASATDACGTPTVTSTTGSIQSSGCLRSQTRSWTATDACGNTSTASRTATWISDTTPPTLNATGGNLTLGCNPSTATIDGALGSASATDACGIPTVTMTTGSIQSSGCLRSQTRSWSAIDGCGNTSTAARTATWTEDNTAPTLTATGGNLTLGCNPSTATIDGALGSASATDACGTPTVTSTTGSIQSSGCLRSQTRSWTAIDICGNTSTTSRTATWTQDVTPPTLTATGGNLTLGCNPTTATIDGALGSASATDACGTPTVTMTTGSIQSSGCLRSQTRSWTAIDGCGNTSTASRTATWISDTTPPTLSATGGNLTLGCNPSTATIDGALGSASATDACGTPTVTMTTGSIQSSGCLRSQTRSWTAIDGCGNTSTAARTATWTEDNTAPTLTATGGNLTLGCNPSTATIDGALGSASATDACGTPTVTSTTGSIQSSGCLRSQTRSWTAIDICGNTSTTSRTATWTQDVTPPTLTATGGNLTLGCNPTTATIDGALGSASATDACGIPTVTMTTGSIQSSGCLRSQTRSWTAIDGCGNTSTASRTATWTGDTTPPTLTPGGNNLALGCNPTSAAINGALGSATATDACGTPTVTMTTGSVQSSGCLRSQTRSWTATDGCGNTSTAARTATWTEDTTPPTLTATGGNLTLGCNPSTASIEAGLGSASATDACGTPTVTSTTGSIQSSGCLRSQTRSWTAIDGCGNTSTTSRTVTWTSDTTPPTIGNTPPSVVNVPCAGNIPPAPQITPDADCAGTPIVQFSEVPTQGDCSNGIQLSIVRTWTITDGCGNSASFSQTVNQECCATTFCTYTQGWYGNNNGMNHCNGTTTYASKLNLINDLIGAGLTVGNGPKSVSVPSGSGSTLISIMPGGGTPDSLKVGGVCAITNACFSTYKTKQGKINNNLLSQTIVLSLNARMIGGALGTVPYMSGYLVTQSASGCGNTFETGPCTTRDTALVTGAVVDYLTNFGNNNATIANLIQLANDVLGGALKPGQPGANGNTVPSYAEVNNAVDQINNIFDECRSFIGYNPAPCPPLKMGVTTPEFKVYPNPNSGYFTVELSAEIENAEVTLLDMSGKVVETKASANRKAMFNASHVVPGIYIIQVKAGQETYRTRVSIL